MMAKNEKADVKTRNYNPVSLGTMYFGFSAALWSSNQISDYMVFVIAIISSIVAIAFFLAVFSEYVLTFLSSKNVVPILVPLTYLVLFIGFTLGWLQALLQTTSIPFQVVAYLGFAWIVVFLLIEIRDAVKKLPPKQTGTSSSIVRLKQYLAYAVVAAFLVVAGCKFCSHDWWGGAYSIAIAGLALSVAMNWLKIHGEIFERPG